MRTYLRTVLWILAVTDLALGLVSAPAGTRKLT